MNTFFQTAQDSEKFRFYIVFGIAVVLAFLLPALIIPDLNPVSEEAMDQPIWQEEMAEESIQQSLRKDLPQGDDELPQDSYGDDFIYLVYEID